MTIFEDALGAISGGQVLDVATSRGGFIEILIENLKDYAHITGLDAVDHIADAQAGVFDRADVTHHIGDAHKMPFEPNSFDTVSISMALHHMADIPAALAEMYRVLRPGGHVIVIEQYRDKQTERQRAWIDFHHWFAEVDSALGVTHNQTLTRQEIVDAVSALPLTAVQTFEVPPTAANPMVDSRINRIDERFASVLERAESLPNFASIKAAGESIVKRLHELGVEQATRLLIVGRK